MKNKYVDKIIEIIMICIALLILIPIYYLVVTTFKTPQEASISPMGFPSRLYLDNYARAWKLMNFPLVLKNNIIITSCSVVGTLVLGSMAAYSLARCESRIHNIIYKVFLSGLMIPFALAIIPLYSLIQSLGLMDSHAGVILINIFVQMPFAIFLLKSFVKTIPIELEEAAYIDGYSISKTFWKITMPLMSPVLVTLSILLALSVWNDFLNPLLFLQTREKGVIIQEIYRNVGQFSVDWTGFFPMLVLGVAPMIILYLALQKHIIKGIAAGSVKG